MAINLASTFNSNKLIRFSLSSMLMMLVLACYTTIDGLFISNYVKPNGIGALNIVMPIITATLALSFMFSTGTNSVISKLMGEDNQPMANRLLTTIYLIAVMVGVVIMGGCLIFKYPLLKLLGANDTLLPLADQYLSTIGWFLPFLFLQDFGQVFFITASKPSFSFIFTLLGGIVNALLDYVFVVKMNLGMQGAALATGIGYLFPAVASVIYFSIRRSDNLCFLRPYFNIKQLLFCFYNGSSEFLSNISYALVTVLINAVMLNIAGVDGVNAIGVILQLQFLQSSLFIGYSIGVLPVISYKFGANDQHQLKAVVKKSIKIILVLSLIIVSVSLIFNRQIIEFYLSSDTSSYHLAVSGFFIYAWSFVVMGLNFFYSMMFTGISDAKNSILIALLRSFVFLIITILVLPKLFGINGVWLAVPVSETLTFIVSYYLYKKYFIKRFIAE